MSARVTRKRARIASEADEPPAGKVEENDQPVPIGDAAADAVGTENVKQDEEFWFSDGTVILVAQDVEFRVYKGPLEDSSSVLKDLLAQSQDTRLLELCGQHDFPCPVVHLTDSPHDLRHVLLYLMPSLGYQLKYTLTSPHCMTEGLNGISLRRHLGRLLEPSFATVSACVRLAQKYELSNLRDASLKYLKIYHPRDFSSWSSRGAWSAPRFEKLHVIGVVNLARLTGEDTILPTALLACIVSLNGEQLFGGFLREDGSKEMLSTADLALCFEAQARLSAAKASIHFRVLSQPAPPLCYTRSTCTSFKRQFLQKLQTQTVALTHGDP